MLQITVPGYEYFDERTNTFGQTKTITLQLEHSLVSLAKWESKWRKPFLGKEEKTIEQCVDYVRCMTITQNVDPLVYNGLTTDMLKTIDEYIESPMTATWFGNEPGGRVGHNAVTAEVIYYWMIALNIPFECQKWHLNRLMTLIRVCNIKSAPQKKRGRQEMLNDRKALNAARRAKSGSKG